MHIPTPQSRARRRLTAAVPVTAALLALVASAVPAAATGTAAPAVPHFTGPHGATLLPAAATAGTLNDTAAVSPNDVWAIGYSAAEDGTYPALAQHFNGHRWSSVSMPNPSGSIETDLFAVTAIASDDVWSVGHTSTSSGVWSTVTEHWDGTSWSIVASPNATGAANSYLYSVSATSSNDVWAVGTGLDGAGNNSTLTEHWNGKKWSVVEAVNPSGVLSEFNGITAVSPDDAWAAGTYQAADGTLPSLIEHWNGKKWKQVKSPSLDGFLLTQLGPLTAPSADDIWSVGYGANSADQLVPLAAHYNGKKWTITLLPNPDGGLGTLMANTSASASDDVWMVGLYLDSTGVGQTLIEHFDGQEWKIVKTAGPPGAANSALSGVASPTSTSAWATGTTQVDGTTVTLLEHWNGKKWKPKQGQ